jgi:hypothetical protein
MADRMGGGFKEKNLTGFRDILPSWRRCLCKCYDGRAPG